MKRKFTQASLVIALLSATLGTTAQAQIPTNGLQICYKFDGNLNDASGNGNNATAIGDYSFASAGNSTTPSDSSFEGTRGLYQLYCDFSSNPTNFKTQEFSYLVWVKFSSVAPGFTNLMEVGSTSTNLVYFRLNNYTTDNNIRLEAGYYSATPAVWNRINSLDIPLANLVDNEWHLLAFTSTNEGTSRYQTIHMDGNLLVDYDFEFDRTIAYDASYNKLNIGCRDNGSTGDFGHTGNINGFLYYNRYLMISEVTDVYNAGVSGLNAINGSTNSINENNITTFKLMPNPANEFVTISNIEAGSTVSLVDLSGKVISQTIANSTSLTIPTSNFNAGVYFVRVMTENGAKAQMKLVVNK
jgi:hypothetical protein